MARLLLFSAWQAELYAALARSTDPTLAGVAGKAVKEVAYHLDHARHWVLRLGDGTDESHARMQAALDAEWPCIEELFDGSTRGPGLVADGVAVDPAALRDAVLTRVEAVVAEATLTVPAGRAGRSAAVGAASTPRRWATCSPRCSTSPAPTRGRRGDRDDRSTTRRAAPGTSPPRCSTPSCRSSPSRTSASCATSPRTTRAASTSRSRPTYSGCPAMETIRTDLVEVRSPGRLPAGRASSSCSSPAWTTDWMTDEGRAKLAAYGIAPPAGRAATGRSPLALSVRCPQCGSLDTRESSRFGSTACKSLWVCRTCREPFDHFKTALRATRDAASTRCSTRCASRRSTS